MYICSDHDYRPEAVARASEFLGQKIVVRSGKAIFPNAFQVEHIPPYALAGNLDYPTAKSADLTWSSINRVIYGFAIDELPTDRPPPLEKPRSEKTKAKEFERAGAAAHYLA